jgi:hypothetical protein
LAKKPFQNLAGVIQLIVSTSPAVEDPDHGFVGDR